MFANAKPEQTQTSKDTIQKKETEQTVASPNITGIPDGMKSRFENLSGFSFDDVRVHYNSGKPAQLQALAYTQGNQVHVGPGQEKHLGHELGHVVQQKQGRVRPTTNISGMAVNDETGLEREADLIGTSSIQFMKTYNSPAFSLPCIPVIQREHVKATCTITKDDDTVNESTLKSNAPPVNHWVTKAMNDGLTVPPKKVPVTKDGKPTSEEVEGNALFQCAEPKSLSSVLFKALEPTQQITEKELNSIKWKDVKWTDSEHREGQTANLCPTCKQWIAESLVPKDTAKNKVKSKSKEIGYFETSEERSKYNEKKEKELKAEQEKKSKAEKEKKRKEENEKKTEAYKMFKSFMPQKKISYNDYNMLTKDDESYDEYIENVESHKKLQKDVVDCEHALKKFCEDNKNNKKAICLEKEKLDKKIKEKDDVEMKIKEYVNKYKIDDENDTEEDSEED